MRRDGRRPTEVRPIRISRGFTEFAEGSVLIEMGATRVLCTATIEDKVPTFLKGSGRGWVTAEYDMLPRATRERTPRAATRGRPSGRSLEIQRLVGRALRAVTVLDVLGERTITLDCDVLQADGGTRTAAITGAFVALVDALATLKAEAEWAVLPLRDWVAAVSVGIVDGAAFLDLNYDEDARAQVDLNVVATARGQLVEIQGGAEGVPFGRDRLNELLDLAEQGLEACFAAQRRALGELASHVGVWPQEGVSSAGSAATPTGAGEGERA
ncbi:MAG TPA: ribonuclease PH [Bacillota bacterium]